jgi:hypothetical protein
MEKKVYLAGKGLDRPSTASAGSNPRETAVWYLTFAMRVEG